MEKLDLEDGKLFVEDQFKKLAEKINEIVDWLNDFDERGIEMAKKLKDYN